MWQSAAAGHSLRNADLGECWDSAINEPLPLPSEFIFYYPVIRREERTQPGLCRATAYGGPQRQCSMHSGPRTPVHVSAVALRLREGCGVAQNVVPKLS
jgi:hypothetical protein